MAFAKIRPRRSTRVQWESINPILEEGELGIEYPDTGIGTGLCKFKLGDGFTKWTKLPYAFDGNATGVNGGNVSLGNDIILRSGTTTDWENSNPVLKNGEIVFDSTLGSFKIGDGKTNFKNLDYFYNDISKEKISSITDIVSLSTLDKLVSGIETGRTLSYILGCIKKGLSLINNKLLSVVYKSDVIDNLTSSFIESPLSANQGRILNEKLNKAKKDLFELIFQLRGYSTAEYSNIAKVTWNVIGSDQKEAVYISYADDMEPVELVYQNPDTKILLVFFTNGEIGTFGVNREYNTSRYYLSHTDYGWINGWIVPPAKGGFDKKYIMFGTALEGALNDYERYLPNTTSNPITNGKLIFEICSVPIEYTTPLRYMAIDRSMLECIYDIDFRE